MAEGKTTKSEPKEEFVKISKSDWLDIKAEIENLKNPGRPRKNERVKQHTAKVFVFNGSPVIGWDDVKGTDPLEWRIHMLDGSSKEVDYLKFLRVATKVPVKILKEDVKIVRAVELNEGGGGIINSHNPDEANISGVRRQYGDEIELEVTWKESTAEVEITAGELNGMKFSINNKYLNP